jgi:hypothetical protein
MVAHTPIATARCRTSTNRVLINDSVEGMSVAPATPSSALARMSSSALGANAARTDTAANATTPIDSRRRLPSRSPTVPMVTRKPAMKNPYASMIHNVWVAVGSSAAAMLGSTR